jgi:hypothetical protein
MTGMPWLVAGAVLAAILGLRLMRAGRGMRQGRGLGGGKTVSLDQLTLTSFLPLWADRTTGPADPPWRHDHSGGMEIQQHRHLACDSPRGQVEGERPPPAPHTNSSLS